MGNQPLRRIYNRRRPLWWEIAEWEGTSKRMAFSWQADTVTPFWSQDWAVLVAEVRTDGLQYAHRRQGLLGAIVTNSSRRNAHSSRSAQFWRTRALAHGRGGWPSANHSHKFREV